MVNVSGKPEEHGSYVIRTLVGAMALLSMMWAVLHMGGLED